MKTKKRKDSELTRLQSEWYAKLKAGGFNDIEQFEPGNHQPNLKSWHSCYFQIRHDPDTFQIKADYYYDAHHYLESGSFDSQTHRQVWKLHVDGHGVRQIAEILAIDGIRLDKDKVAAIVRIVKEQMLLDPEERAKQLKDTVTECRQMNLFDETS